MDTSVLEPRHVMMLFGTLACAAVGLLSTTLWRTRTSNTLFASAILATSLWGLASLVVELGHGKALARAMLSISEAACLSLWLWNLLRWWRANDSTDMGASYESLLAATAVATLGAGSLGSLVDTAWAFAVSQSLLLLLATGSAALAATLHFATPMGHRRLTKFLYFAVGALSAYAIGVHTRVLLALQVEPWHAETFATVLLLSAGLLLPVARRVPIRTTRVVLSRALVLFLTTLLLSALYLLIVAMIGIQLRVFAGSWGIALQSASVVCGIALLALILLSDRMRAWLRVTLSKHFFALRYDYRTEWLRFSRTLSNPGEEGLRERALQAMAQFMEAPGALLWARDETGKFLPVASWRMSELPYSLASDTSLARFLQDRHWVVDLEEYRSQPNQYPDLTLPHWLFECRNAWLLSPLMHLNDLYGFVVLKRSRALRSINWEDHDLLKTAGRQLSSYLALMDASEALARSRQFDTYNRMSAYVMHDLKNSAAQISLMASNAKRLGTNPRFLQDLIATLESVSEKIQDVVHSLRDGSWDDGGQQRTLQIEDIIERVARKRSVMLPRPKFVRFAHELTLFADPGRVETVLENIVANAQEATEDGGAVLISLKRDHDFALVEISDTGTGMDGSFLRERLFRPFDSTKGSNGMGIGAYECRELVHNMGGTLEVTSIPGEGTRFSIRLPTGHETIREAPWTEIAGAAS